MTDFLYFWYKWKSAAALWNSIGTPLLWCHTIDPIATTVLSLAGPVRGGIKKEVVSPYTKRVHTVIALFQEVWMVRGLYHTQKLTTPCLRNLTPSVSLKIAHYRQAHLSNSPRVGLASDSHKYLITYIILTWSILRTYSLTFIPN